MNDKAYIIYLEDSILLSKKEYLDWRDIQDEYYGKYKANFSPMTCEEIIFFFETDFKDEINWPFTRIAIEEFFESPDSVILSKLS